MKNLELSKLFNEIGDLLDIKGENPFKVKAYRRAAQVLESLTEGVESLIRRGELTKVPGIGASIAEKINEYLNTGKCKYYEDLLKEFPRGLIEMLSIPEVGPKTAQVLYKELGITSIEELEKSCREHKLANLPRFGKKTEENILAGIELLRRQKGRVPLMQALPFAQKVSSLLKELKEVEQLEVSGSLRRYKETIGDIDILVTSKASQKVMDTFTSQGYVERILAKGATKSSVLANLGGGVSVQMDVRVVEPESFGAALQYFTGSKDHNIKLREMAGKRGLKISEYGVFRVKDDSKVAGKTEAEVYGTLSLPWIPPELREDMGEIEAAQANKLPKLIELEDIKGDLQIHSKWSDGSASIKEIANAAIACGYEYIAISDHSKAVGIAGGLDEKELLEQIAEIDALNRKSDNFYILKGCEVDIRADGSLDIADEVLKKLDWVIAAVHSGFKMDIETMTRRIIRGLENPYVHALAHPSGRVIGKRDPYQVDIERVLEVAAKRGIILELNAYPDRLDLKDIYLKRAKELGIPVVINTDSHAIHHLDFMRYGIFMARRGWLEKDNVINTLPLDKLLKRLKHK